MIRSAAWIFAAAWLGGIAVLPSPVDMASTVSEMLAAYAGHEARLALPFAITQVVAPVAMLVVVFGLWRALPHAPGSSAAHAMLAGAAASPMVAGLQCGIGRAAAAH